MDRVDLTNHQLAKKLGTTRAQLWRWKEFVVLDDGSMLDPKMVGKLSDFNLTMISGAWSAA